MRKQILRKFYHKVKKKIERKVENEKSLENESYELNVRTRGDAVAMHARTLEVHVVVVVLRILRRIMRIHHLRRC